jgi:hypothetical protein
MFKKQVQINQKLAPAHTHCFIWQQRFFSSSKFLENDDRDSTPRKDHRFKNDIPASNNAESLSLLLESISKRLEEHPTPALRKNKNRANDRSKPHRVEQKLEILEVKKVETQPVASVVRPLPVVDAEFELFLDKLSKRALERQQKSLPSDASSPTVTTATTAVTTATTAVTTAAIAVTTATATEAAKEETNTQKSNEIDWLTELTENSKPQKPNDRGAASYLHALPSFSDSRERTKYFNSDSSYVSPWPRKKFTSSFSQPLSQHLKHELELYLVFNNSG